MKIFDTQSYSREALQERLGSMDQLAGMRMVEAADGMAKGSRMIEAWTGTGLSFTILADRAMDISACSYRGVPLAFSTPNGDAHPAFYDPDRLEWLRTFQGGLLATCGLDQFGPPNVDEGVEYGQHGRIGAIPARYAGYHAGWQGDRYELAAYGEVRQARIFGENMVMRRRIVTALGSNVIRIENEVTNEGFDPWPLLILFHFNLGFPLLSEKAELRVDSTRTTARNADAEKGIDNWMRFETPTPGYVEQVFRHVPQAGPDGNITVELRNPDLGLGLRWSYPQKDLPYLYQWKMMGQGTYVLGVEPSNSSTIDGRAAARATGEMPILQPGESRKQTIEVEVFDC